MLKPSVLKELKAIVGSEHLYTSPEQLTVYSYDATQQESMPWAVVRPGSAEEISKIMVLANSEVFPVIPRGAGTGMSGGSVPVCGGVVLSLERMNRIIEIDEDNLIALVEPGVVTGDLQREVESRGLFYPPDPASHQFCTIGGNVAECAGGLRAVKYGVTKDYVLGLELVLPDGEIIHAGTRTAKSVVGYDLTKLVVGSEGTLAIATKIILRLLPLPETVRTLSAFFRTVYEAAAAASAIMKARILPRALELIDHAALRAVENYTKEDFSGGAGGMLLIEVDGPSESTAQEIERVRETAARFGAVRTIKAATDSEREQLWRARRSISPALYTLKPKKINEDIVVPRNRISEILRAIDDIGNRHGLLIVNFGHAGDGNIHTNIMIDEADRTKGEAAVREILKAVLSLQGSISGEHGIGLSKAAYLSMELGPHEIAIMKKIKEALDPKNILNPGKIFFSAE